MPMNFSSLAAVNSPAAILFFLTLTTIGTPGCSQRAVAERQVFSPPYHVDPNDPSRLIVREDLWTKLKFDKVGNGDVDASLIGYGQIAFAPDASYAVHVPYVAYVSQVFVEVDDPIHKGQPLLELRSSEVARLRAELANTEVELKTEKAALQRLELLLADGTATEKEVLMARSRIEVLAATVAGAKASFAASGIDVGQGERFVIRAPAPGRVLNRGVAAGERVSPDNTEPIFLIGDPRRLVVRAAFLERDAIWLKEGARCVVLINALGETRFEGRITRLVRAVDPETRSADAICTPTLDDPRISARMLARVEVNVTGAAKIFAPRSAVLLRRDDYFVFVRVGKDTIERRKVHPSLRIGDYVSIQDGLSPDDEVIAEGAVLLDGELDQIL